MNKRLLPLILIAILIGSCALAPASTAPPTPATATQAIVPYETPTPTQTEIPTAIQNNFSITQIRTPSDTDGRQVLTAFWSQDGTAIYYALVNEIGDTSAWFEISLGNEQDYQSTQLSSHPELIYTPFLPVEGLYLEYHGFISPTNQYQFQITRAEYHSLYLIDNLSQSKVKLLETSDINFRKAYWIFGENRVFFGIGPEYGTELYLYDIESEKLLSSKELIGFEDWNLLEWVPSPDGKHIAIFNGNQLFIYSTDGSYSISLHGWYGNVRWSGNGERIYFYYGEQWIIPTNLGYFELATQTVKDVSSISALELDGIKGFFDVSPDGNQLVFWQAGNIWIVSFN